MAKAFDLSKMTRNDWMLLGAFGFSAIALFMLMRQRKKTVQAVNGAVIAEKNLDDKLEEFAGAVGNANGFCPEGQVQSAFGNCVKEGKYFSNQEAEEASNAVGTYYEDIDDVPVAAYMATGKARRMGEVRRAAVRKGVQRKGKALGRIQTVKKAFPRLQVPAGTTEREIKDLIGKACAGGTWQQDPTTGEIYCHYHN